MTKRRKIVRPDRYITKHRLGKKVTRKKVGLVFAKMRAAGRTSSSSVDIRPTHETVWVDKSDPCARAMEAAARKMIVSIDDLPSLLSRPDMRGFPKTEFTDLGIVGVPDGDDRVRLVGAPPQLARIINGHYHGKKKRAISRRELIETVFGFESNGRATSVTQLRLQESLLYVEREFGVDFSDLICGDPIYV